MSGDVMTTRDRDTLSKIARQRARVAKSMVAQRQAQLLADFEAQSSAIYSARDEAWAEVVHEAEAKVGEVNAHIAEVCRQRNIPVEFAPSLSAYFAGRGQNDDISRRVELRKLAERKIDAAAKSAKLEIDRADGQVQVELLTCALSTEAARVFLDQIPTPEQLMPAIQLGELEQQIRRTPTRRELW